MRDAAVNAVRGARVVGRGADRAAREVVGGSVRAAGGMGLETGALVRDVVIGVIEGSGQVMHVTKPAIRDVVAGGIGEGHARADIEGVGKDVVAGAIVGADSVGLSESEAVAAAVEGAVEGFAGIGADIGDAAQLTVGGVVSGVASTGGDVEAATRDAANLLVAEAAELGAGEIADVATRVIDAALDESEMNADIGSEVVVAAAVGAVEAAYRVDTSQGERVRARVMGHVRVQSAARAERLRSRLPEIAEQLSRELPRGRAAWRGAAMFRAVRVLYDAGGIDLAGSLAYFTILALFPLIALVIMGFIYLGDPEGVRAQLADALGHYFPASSALIQEVVGGLFGGSITLSVVALLSMLIGVNGLFRATNRAVNRVFGIRGGNVVQTTVSEVAIAAILAGVFLLSLFLTAFFYTATTLGASSSMYPEFVSWFIRIIISILSLALPIAVTAVIFSSVYRHLPNVFVEWRDATFGALVAIVLFELAKHGFFWFTNLATDRNVIYGPVASFVVLLMWAYVGGLIFLYGAALTKAAADLRPRPYGAVGE